jgi:SAM-dependent methyltransferase
MTSAPDTANSDQREVVETYNARATSTGDIRNNWTYMTSKQLCDFRLLADAGLDDATVLNVGCFFPLDELAFVHRVRHWTAVDLGEATIREAHSVACASLPAPMLERLSFQVADGTALPFETNSFDVTMSMSTVDHIVTPEGRQKLIAEMARVTRPGGHVVVTVPNRWNRGYARRGEVYGLRLEFYEYCFSPPELHRMVRLAGLKPVRFTSTSEALRLSPRAFLPRLGGRRPLLATYNHVARYLGARMGVLAVKP